MRYLYIMFSLCILATACKTSSKTEQVDTPSEGRIRISVEESFKPFIEQELKVFALSFPKATIEVSYKSEIDCFKDLASDSTRMIIVTRGLDKKEQASYKDQLSYAPTFGILAYNAIAVVVNKKSKDSVFTMAELGAALSGQNNKQVVMDGSHLTGVVRFLKDSLLHETPFGKNVVSANGSEEVISYIKNNPNVYLKIAEAKTKSRIANGYIDTITALRNIANRNYNKSLQQLLLEKNKDYIFRYKEIVTKRQKDKTREAQLKKPTSYSKLFDEYLTTVDLLYEPTTNKKRVFYSLRHSYATFQLLYENTNIEVLARQMGTSMAMISKFYSDVTAKKATEQLRGNKIYEMLND
jgi:hypothetical protein